MVPQFDVKFFHFVFYWCYWNDSDDDSGRLFSYPIEVHSFFGFNS